MIRLFLGLLILLLPFPLLSQDKPASKVNITEMVFVPPVYYVGDQVELRLTLQVPEGVQVIKSRELPSQQWVTIRNLEVRQDPPFVHVTVQFVSFAPGTKTLPPLPLGDVVLDDLRIFTSSILENEAKPELAPPRDQMVVSHTEIFFVVLVLAVLILPVFLWRFSRPLVKRFEAFLAWLQRRKPHRLLQKELKVLQQKVLGLTGPDFYTRLSAAGKTYLSGRLKREMGSMTASELAARLPFPHEWSDPWVGLIHKADVVRFDSRDPSGEERLGDLETLRREAQRLESKEAYLVDL